MNELDFYFFRKNRKPVFVCLLCFDLCDEHDVLAITPMAYSYLLACNHISIIGKGFLFCFLNPASNH